VTGGDGSGLSIRRQAPVEVWTLNRPEARNCLSESVLAALTHALDRVSTQPSVRAIVLAAEGSVFSSGHDLKELSAHRRDPDRGAQYFADIMDRCAAMMAAGCQLVATCDLAVAGREARFATPGVNIGLFCSTPMVALSRNVPRKVAMEMLLLGDMLDAEGAKASGLVNRVVDSGQALAAAIVLAERIAAKSAVTVSIGKTAYYQQLEMALPDAYTYASAVMVRNMLEGDAVEGIDAFLTKRVPQWKS
jgi:enoyl-CoA hydratase/carnithine racemase